MTPKEKAEELHIKFYDAIPTLPNKEQKPHLHKTDVSVSLTCGCLKCYPNVFPNLRFNVCPICGNKRCPHATDHNYECTNSNDVGQNGSVYGGNDR